MEKFLDDNNRKYILNALLAVLVLLAVFLGAQAVNTIKEYSYIGRGVYATNTITVSGKGEVVVVPDTGSFSFSVAATAKTVKEAQDQSAKKINSIIDALKTMNVLEKDIKTTSYNAYPKYEWRSVVCSSEAGAYCPSGRQVLIGYEVSQSISVKVRKTADAGAVLTKVGELGATDISSLSFVVDDMDKVLIEARDKAITDAKVKAVALEESLGVKFKKIINFYESGNNPAYYGMGNMEAKDMMTSTATPPQTPVGENTVTSNVTITYEVE